MSLHLFAHGLPRSSVRWLRGVCGYACRLRWRCTPHELAALKVWRIASIFIQVDEYDHRRA